MNLKTDLRSGFRLGNYELCQAIGEGTTAAVWSVRHHERPNRDLAMKIAVESRFQRQLTQEGRLVQIDHPNVAPILDSDTRATIPYIVMPRYTDGSLCDLLRRHPQGLPEEQVVQLLDDILSGLAAAHSQGIIHRDVKPSNIMLQSSGRAVVADFGLSLYCSHGDRCLSIVQSLSFEAQRSDGVAGSLAYMAPEVLDGAPPEYAADVYAVGVVLFEMLTGQRPCGPTLPTDLRSNLANPAAWNELYRKACASLPHRPARASDLLDELRCFGMSATTSEPSSETPSSITRLEYVARLPLLFLLFFGCLLATPAVVFAAWQVHRLRQGITIAYQFAWLPAAILFSLGWLVQLPFAFLYFLWPITAYYGTTVLKWKSVFLSFVVVCFHINRAARIGVWNMTRTWADVVLSLGTARTSDIGGFDYFTVDTHRGAAAKAIKANDWQRPSGIRRHTKAARVIAYFGGIAVWLYVSGYTLLAM